MCLGKGTFGEAYLVTDDDEPAVLKVGTAHSSFEQFLREFEILQTLDGAGGAPLALRFRKDPLSFRMTFKGR